MPKVSLYRNRVPVKLGHKYSQGRYSMLELDEGKPSRPVLRRGDGSNSVSLAGIFMPVPPLDRRPTLPVGSHALTYSTQNSWRAPYGSHPVPCRHKVCWDTMLRD